VLLPRGCVHRLNLLPLSRKERLHIALAIQQHAVDVDTFADPDNVVAHGPLSIMNAASSISAAPQENELTVRVPRAWRAGVAVRPWG